LALLILPQEGGGKVVFGEPAGYPILDPYEVLLGQGVVKQLIFILGMKKASLGVRPGY